MFAGIDRSWRYAVVGSVCSGAGAPGRNWPASAAATTAL
jgi:hypothetical protein